MSEQAPAALAGVAKVEPQDAPRGMSSVAPEVPFGAAPGSASHSALLGAYGETHAPSHGTLSPNADPTLRPAFSRGNRIARLLWGVVYVLLYRPSPRPFHAWRAFLLRLFGARLGPKCHFYPKGRIWAPWNLQCADRVSLADDAELYNPALFTLGSHAIVSQGAYVCGATHTYNDPGFPLVSAPMQLGAYSWVCARAIVSPGVSLGTGAILGLGAIATRDLEPFGVYAGVPAKKVKERERTAVPQEFR